MTTATSISDITTTPDKRPSRRATPSSKPKLAPRWAVVLHNDSVHSMTFVAETLCKVFRYSTAESRRMTGKIHREGQGIVWTGSREVAELKRDQLRSAGPDFYLRPAVRIPLNVDLLRLDEV